MHRKSCFERVRNNGPLIGTEWNDANTKPQNRKVRWKPKREREQRISNGSPSSGSILPLKLLLVIRRHILWKRNGRDQREKSKKGEEKKRKRKEISLSFDHRVLCVCVCACGGHQKSGHANRGEVSGDFISHPLWK